MRIRSALLALSLVPAAVFSTAFAPAVDTETLELETCTTVDDGGTTDVADDDVVACEAAVYYDCSTAHGGKVHVPSSLGTGVKLVDAAPETSFTAGGGCGQAEPSQARGTATTSIYDMNATGFIQGNLDTVSVELHSIYAGSLRAGGAVTLDLRMVLGGESLVGSTSSPGPTGDPIASPKSFRLEVPLETSATGLSESMTFTITDLYELLPQLSTAGDGTGNYQTLDVTVAVIETDWAGAFVWGATEVPANVTINGGERGLTVSALELQPVA